jgi:hypothetical protein
MEQQLNLWNEFCNQYFQNKFAVPLFSTNGKIVNTQFYGRGNKRLLLKRSDLMDALVIEEVTKVLNDFKQRTDIYEGLIYMMYWLNGQQVIPLYIGKSEKYGKTPNKLSTNICKIAINKTDKSKFCRWGDGYDYHIGDLSAVVCPGHSINKITPKYQRWANRLFESYPTQYPTLRQATYFWIHAWERGTVGIAKELGSTSLTFQEYLLIGLASVLFPNSLLNQEGVNRK